MGVSKAYLVAYNVCQFVGWTWFMLRLYPYLLSTGKSLQSSGINAKIPKDLYADLGGHIRCIQTAAVLEIFHAAFGLVRSNPMITAVQIFSRLAVLWIPVHHVAASQITPGLPIMLFAWTLTEIIRYAFYTLNLINLNLTLVTWLRYTLFIVLYPLGVTGELWCYFASLSAVKASGLYSMAMPNALNFTFNLYVVFILVMLGYIPGFPPMYFHMFAQRRKIFGPQGKTKKTA